MCIHQVFEEGVCVCAIHAYEYPQRNPVFCNVIACGVQLTNVMLCSKFSPLPLSIDSLTQSSCMVKIVVSIYEVIAVVIFKGAHRIEVSGFFVWRTDSVGSETQTCGLRETYKNVHNIVLFTIFSDF